MFGLIAVWALAALFTLNSLIITLRTNYNAGTTAMWVVSATLILYGAFYRQVNRFAATGPGRGVVAVVLAGCAVYVGLMIFIGLAGRSATVKGDEKALIVLGAGLRGSQVGDLLRRRLAAALKTHGENPSTLIVVSGGKGPGESVSEAAAMARWLVERGVPEESIILEDQSVSTEENLRFSKALLAERGIGPEAPVAVVTNTFHCYRAGWNVRKCGYTNARLVPASMNATTFLQNYLREVMALVKTWSMGRSGAA